MYKLFKISIFLFLLLISLGVNASVNFDYKLDGNPDNTYGDNILDVNVGQIIDFRTRTLSTNKGDYQIVFGNGFEKVNYSNNCSNFSTGSITNSSFSYNLNHDSGVCSVVLNYKTLNPGTKSVSLFKINDNSSTLIKTLQINVNQKASLLKSKTIDNNNDGYLNSLELEFSKDIASYDFNGILIGGQAPASIIKSGNKVTLNIDDNIFNSGERPAIDFNGNTDIQSINNFIPEDNAKPVLWKVNNQGILGQNSISIGSGSINFTFSEQLHPSSNFELKKGENPISGNFNINNNILIFTPSSPLEVGNYKLVPGDNAKDFSSNQNQVSNISVSLIIQDTEKPKGLPIGTSTGILINNGSSNTNNRSVQLQLLATDNVGVTQMMISNNSDFSGANWENYSTSKNNWDLGATTGLKTVYVKFRDAAGNVSPTYSASIEYAQSLNYLNFDNSTNLFTDNNTILIKGGCSNLSSTEIKFSINNGLVGTFNCNNTSKNWSNTFTLEENTQNNIKIWYGDNYNDATIKNSITITNPETTCNTGYTRVGNTCIPNSCEAETKNIDGRIYNVPAISHGSSGIITSNSFNIDGGNITYKQEFSCNLGTISPVGVETPNTPSCDAGYTIDGITCIPSNCNAQTSTVESRTYQVPALSHGNNSNITSNPISITGGSITYKLNFSCSFGVLNENPPAIANTPICNDGYAANGNECSLLTELACSDSFEDGDKIYSNGTIAHSGTGTRISEPIKINNGTITYNQKFSCSFNDLEKIGEASKNTPTCNDGYSVDGYECKPSSCSNTEKTINNRTYQVPSIVHNGTGSVVSNTISITGGTITYSQVFRCELGEISKVGEETKNTPSCSSGYRVNGFNCEIVRSSGGGGGGGGSSLWFPPVVIPEEDKVDEIKEDKIPEDKYTPTQQDEIISEIVKENISNDFSNYLEINNIQKSSITLDTAQSFLTKNTNKGLSREIQNYKNRISIDNIEFFASLDINLRKEYNKMVLNYTSLFENINNHINTPSRDKLFEAYQSYTKMMSIYNNIKSPENRYITREDISNNIVYKTKVTQISNQMDLIENVMIQRYNNYLTRGTISRSKYNEMISDYNNFVLYLSTFRVHRDSKSRELGQKYLTKVINNYYNR